MQPAQAQYQAQYQSWGRYPKVRQHVRWLSWLSDDLTLADLPGIVLPYGQGRSYGDCCLNANGTLLDTASLNRFIAFDPDSGLLQCEAGVTPFVTGTRVIADLLIRIAKSGLGSSLAVLKTFGSMPSPGLLSFPRPGVTLALDFPNHGQATLRLFEDLDQTVRECGGESQVKPKQKTMQKIFIIGATAAQRIEGPAIRGLSKQEE